MEQHYSNQQIIEGLKLRDRTIISYFIKRLKPFIKKFVEKKLFYKRFDSDAIREETDTLLNETYLKLYEKKDFPPDVYNETISIFQYINGIYPKIWYDIKFKQKAIHKNTINESDLNHSNNGGDDGEKMEHNLSEVVGQYSENEGEYRLNKEDKEKLWHELLSLFKPKQREIIHLAWKEKLPYREIADKLGTTEGTIKGELYKIKKVFTSDKVNSDIIKQLLF